MDDHVPLARELDSAHLQDAGAGAGKLEHVVIGNLVELLRARADAGVGGVDAVDVGIDLAHVSFDAPRHGDRRGVGTAAAERGHVVVVVDALEPGDDGDDALVHRVHDAVAAHAHDLRLVVRAVGADARLAAREAHGAVAERLDRHGQKRHRHLLAGREQAVELARGRVGIKGVRQAHQLVGRLAHRRHDGDHVVAGLLLGDQFFRNHLDALGRRDRRPSEFAYD